MKEKRKRWKKEVKEDGVGEEQEEQKKRGNNAGKTMINALYSIFIFLFNKYFYFLFYFLSLLN